MTRCYVIDPEVRPSRPWPGKHSNKLDRGLRILECDVTTWRDGLSVRMALHGKVAVPFLRTARPEIRIERWQVWQDETLDGGWIAYVQRDSGEARLRRSIQEHQIELLVGCILLFVAAVLAALILVVLPQCQGGQIG